MNNNEDLIKKKNQIAKQLQLIGVGNPPRIPLRVFCFYNSIVFFIKYFFLDYFFMYIFKLF